MQKRNVLLGSAGILVLFFALLRFFGSAFLADAGKTSAAEAGAKQSVRNLVDEVFGNHRWDADRLWVRSTTPHRRDINPDKLKAEFTEYENRFGELMEMTIRDGGLEHGTGNGDQARASFALQCRFARGAALIYVELAVELDRWAVDKFVVSPQ